MIPLSLVVMLARRSRHGLARRAVSGVLVSHGGCDARHQFSGGVDDPTFALHMHGAQLGPALAGLHEKRAPRIVAHPGQLLAARADVDLVVEHDKPHGQGDRPPVFAQGHESAVDR